MANDRRIIVIGIHLAACYEARSQQHLAELLKVIVVKVIKQKENTAPFVGRLGRSGGPSVQQWKTAAFVCPWVFVTKCFDAITFEGLRRIISTCLGVFMRLEMDQILPEKWPFSGIHESKTSNCFPETWFCCKIKLEVGSTLLVRLHYT